MLRCKQKGLMQMFVTTFRTRNENAVQQISPGLIDPCPYQPRKLLNKQALEDLA